MDPVVTARVPEGVRDRGNEVLKDIGSSVTELVNAAFDYVIRERHLPQSNGTASESSTLRRPTKKQIEQATAFMNAVKVDVPSQWANRSFEELLDEAMEERYAHLR